MITNDADKPAQDAPGQAEAKPVPNPAPSALTSRSPIVPQDFKAASIPLLQPKRGKR